MQGTCSGSTKEEHVSFSVWQLAAEYLWGIRGQESGVKLTAFTGTLSCAKLYICSTQAKVHLQALCQKSVGTLLHNAAKPKLCYIFQLTST